MQWKNTPGRYGYITLLLHWLVALSVYGMFALGLWMVTLGYYDSWYHPAPELHKSIGIILFAVMIFRVVWRFFSPPPKSLASYSPATKLGALAVHLLLYGILFAIFISGYLISTADGQPIVVFGLFSVPATLDGLGEQADLAGNIHLWLAWSVVVLSALHALAALKHHFIDRDSTLKRMLGKSPE
ncbi:cytochrome b [Erwinia tracheiphila]|uniref:Cytochrome b n=1 Tax=Erwinia tracheiphila TaxID=65700 RepID=A0A345CRT2_9GAMM|nr:cytochrome b [Erwinia tracheiphila]AXF76149.1 cytochrome b [Erwinia tracheiphila]UIA85183.1 cytochrome b [Erwinia tracheiphila]UIA93783.1 cytochrome b [Erwinia tracheiphila]